jgi:hypothetical protein
MGNAIRKRRKFVRIFTTISLRGSNFGFSTRSRFHLKTLGAEFKQLLNQVQGSKAQNTKTG